MLRFLITRSVSAGIVVLGVVGLVFLLIHAVPGDPIEVMLGENARPSDREALRRALALDQPIRTQFMRYLSDLAHGELGESLHSRRPVVEVLVERIPTTAALAVVSLGVAIALAFPLGILAAVHKGTFVDTFAMAVASTGISIPNFVMGPILILIFSYWLGWFPVSGRAGAISFVLPALTLGSALAAILARMIRASLLDVLGADFIRTARAKGLSEPRVVLGHALRNAMLPTLTILGLQLGTLLGGTVITEIVFSWPGIGQLTIESIHRRDYPMLQGCVLVIALAYVVVNTLTDVVYVWLDPRIRLRDDA